MGGSVAPATAREGPQNQSGNRSLGSIDGGWGGGWVVRAPPQLQFLFFFFQHFFHKLRAQLVLQKNYAHNLLYT
jgi:hypothetical protein